MATTCDATSAACKTTTHGLDNCGQPCTKNGPTHCYVVHAGCANAGTPTDATSCDTIGAYSDCGLQAGPSGCPAERWANNIGADCTYCTVKTCNQVSGPDYAIFTCGNLSVPPTP